MAIVIATANATARPASITGVGTCGRCATEFRPETANAGAAGPPAPSISMLLEWLAQRTARSAASVKPCPVPRLAQVRNLPG
ncbi:MAG: hypothetical protein ACRDLC_10740, partial [Actinomycetota bacterium]